MTPKETQREIIYTITDEAPALATHSLLPVLQAFAGAAGVNIGTRDISLVSRILALFPERLSEEQQKSDDLAELGSLVKRPEANVIKLPNISASIPQLQAAIKELQDHGFDLPDYPEDPSTDEEKELKTRYARVLGSAVNPVLREGNSDRRVAPPVKAYAQKHPHSMGDWRSDSLSHVSFMGGGDFYASEKSVVMQKADTVRIQLKKSDGTTEILKEELALEEGEVFDASFISARALKDFYAAQIEEAKQQGVLFSLHLKATMMKVSDPVMFGYAVQVFYKEVFDKYADVFDELGVDISNGLADVYARIESLPQELKEAIKKDIQDLYASRPALAMVDSDKGITNLHVPNNVIIDASMPAAIRTSGQMWGPDGQLADTKFVIPDRCYAGIYDETVRFCKANGAFDPATMGNVANVGLMARKAEEYGSHDKTFILQTAGTIEVVDSGGRVLTQHEVEAGDIWRACQAKDEPIRDWVRLAVSRARATGSPAIFWLDPKRAHDAILITKVKSYLSLHNTEGLEISIQSPRDAIKVSLQRAKEGKDTISVTGNVLRDYLTDLFPILELGTSAKMLSIVPLLAGGGLFETGAGGSAPKHVQQFVKEGHLRWDSLGEFLALAVSFEDLGEKSGNARTLLLGKTLNQAIGTFLDEGKSPSRKVHELDNRGSHYYLALYWAQALAAQNEDADLRDTFATLASELADNEDKICKQLLAAQGQAVDLGGYYHTDDQRTRAAMRPSETLNGILAAFAGG